MLSSNVEWAQAVGDRDMAIIVKIHETHKLELLMEKYHEVCIAIPKTTPDDAASIMFNKTPHRISSSWISLETTSFALRATLRR